VLPLAVSIDVTWRCNLCCRHCYFVRQGLRGELGEDEWARILSSLPVANAVWVGGEPLLRADLIERLRRLFPVNWVVTNGTLPIPNWRDVVFFVSVDGTEPYHDRVRGRGTYRRVRDVIESHDNRHTYLGTVISSLNRSCVGELVNEWSSSSVRGVNFDSTILRIRSSSAKRYKDLIGFSIGRKWRNLVEYVNKRIGAGTQ